MYVEPFLTLNTAMYANSFHAPNTDFLPSVASLINLNGAEGEEIIPLYACCPPGQPQKRKNLKQYQGSFWREKTEKVLILQWIWP